MSAAIVHTGSPSVIVGIDFCLNMRNQFELSTELLTVQMPVLEWESC